MVAITKETNPDLFVKDKGTGAAAGAATLGSDFSFFLKMLTTQLKNQDPTAPMDVAQMTAQIAQYSQIEQQVATNSNLEKLVASNAATTRQSQLSTAISYIGSEVETKGNTGQLIGSQASFSYILPEAAKTVEVVIKNSAGQTVYAGVGPTAAGRNKLLWDGSNSVTGDTCPDGKYTITVNAKDAGSEKIEAETRAVGIVEGIETLSNGTVVVQVSGQAYEFDKILAVRPYIRVDLEGDETAENTDNSNDEADAA